MPSRSPPAISTTSPVRSTSHGARSPASSIAITRWPVRSACAMASAVDAHSTGSSAIGAHADVARARALLVVEVGVDDDAGGARDLGGADREAGVARVAWAMQQEHRAAAREQLRRDRSAVRDRSARPRARCPGRGPCAADRPARPARARPRAARARSTRATTSGAASLRSTSSSRTGSPASSAAVIAAMPGDLPARRRRGTGQPCSSPVRRAV